ncbi:conserved hypothetical protein [metagenome]|uniref:Sulfotransferase n=1 Tax=metagenome TaxID=256318 RepID=A0A2P2C310_9ZZZZ
MHRSESAPERPVVVYIGGSGRSGSTLLECLLARIEDVVVLGEVAHIWQRGVLEDQRCACGESFSACPFWTAIGERAFGGWHEVDVEHVLTLRDAVDRQRRMASTVRRNPTPAITSAAIEYAEFYRRIYDAASAISGASVVVDSSKVAPTALALSHHPSIDLRILHIVRDSRGVAYSWTKVVSRPETETGEPMPQLSSAKSTALWLSHNLSISGLSYRGFPLSRIRYEELVADPAATVRRAWHDLDLPGDGELPMIDTRTIELRPTHSVAGNPMRFTTGETTLRPDTAWQRAMKPRDRWAVTLMTYPVLRYMGYRRRDNADA